MPTCAPRARPCGRAARVVQEVLIVEIRCDALVDQAIRGADPHARGWLDLP
jgi:hypothetical protein